MKCGALIVAAGEGKRLGSSLPKAFVPLASKPLFQHSLEVFQNHSAIQEIVLVVPSGEERKISLTGVKIVAGGKERQDSVWNGLQSFSKECEAVLVHDAARPLLTSALIDRLVEALKQKHNAIPAIAVADTIKQVEENRIIKTVDRASLMRAQTPQACLMEDLKKSFQKAKKEGWMVTDEAGLLEKAGIPVFIVAGDPLNIKITTEQDLHFAEAILERKK